MDVYITKYCLSEGIKKIEVEQCNNDGLVCHRIGGIVNYYHGEGKDWHKTIDSAIAKAEDMRQKKIISLQKQIVKLSKLNFA